MHAVFKDERDRVVESIVGVDLVNEGAWLALRPDAAICEVYEDDNRVRGKLVAIFARDGETGRWFVRPR